MKSSITESAAREIERYRSETSRYRRVYAGIEKRAYASQNDPMPAEEFARELVTQAFASPPPRVILLGGGTDILTRFGEMPVEQRDAMLASNFGLDALAD